MAEELAVEHCSFYGDKTSKAVKGFFLNQVYRSWGQASVRRAKWWLQKKVTCALNICNRHLRTWKKKDAKRI